MASTHSITHGTTVPISLHVRRYRKPTVPAEGRFVSVTIDTLLDDTAGLVLWSVLIGESPVTWMDGWIPVKKIVSTGRDVAPADGRTPES